ncbi:MAG: HYExAFE family protein, partial [Pirellulaceae bacterium]|nr:HYExAFE family protein [Pirellulaceae bacterium]
SGDEQPQYWKNWSTTDDLVSLRRWESLFGAQFVGLFVFAYNIVGDRAPLPAEQLFEFREALYGFVAVRLGDYEASARPISPAWDTVAVPTAEFRRMARPVERFILADGPEPVGLFE